MMKKVKPSFILMTAIVILWVTTGILLSQCLFGNDGQMSYTLDDAFIHLAIAKNIAVHGVFGITPFEFSSAESSLLWGFLLSAVAKVIPNLTLLTYAPLLLNLVFATGLLVIAQTAYEEGTVSRWSTRRGLIQFGNLLFLIALIFVSPLPWLIFSGMEHTLQAALVTGFVYLSARRLSEDFTGGWSRLDAKLLLLAPLVSTVRYENLFPLAVVSLLFLLRKRLAMAVVVAGAGVFPLLLFGAASVWHGSFWLPNSVILKGRFGDAGTQALIEALPHPLVLFQLSERPYLILLLTASSVLAVIRLLRFRSDLRKGFWHPAPLLTLIFFCVTAMNLQSALLRPVYGTTLWYVRYDAYLVVLGLTATALTARDFAAGTAFVSTKVPDSAIVRLLFRPLIVALSIFSALAPIAVFEDRAVDSIVTIPQCSHNIYSQQWQMGKFVRRYYSGDVIALNDIGAVNYLTDIHCVDMYGLATVEIAKSKLARTFDTTKIRSVNAARGTKVAIVYSSWFYSAGGLPKEWELVGQWQIPHNLICGDSLVSFYAVDPREEDRLIRNLHEFSKSLPPDVLQGIKR